MDRLAYLNRILIKQKIELLEIITTFETNNRYAICDSNGAAILMAVEDTNCCTRNCCKDNRPFTFDVMDMSGVPQIRIRRIYTVNCVQCCNCSECCRDTVMVECPPGYPVGSVKQEPTYCTINYSIRDVNDQPILYLKGPSYCLCTCPGTVHTINILTADQSMEIGKLMKVWSGLVKELFTDADNFVLEFPAIMPVSHKALLIGAALLFDFMFFEDNESQSGGKGFF